MITDAHNLDDRFKRVTHNVYALLSLRVKWYIFIAGERCDCKLKHVLSDRSV